MSKVRRVSRINHAWHNGMNWFLKEHSYLYATTPVPHIIWFLRLGKSTKVGWLLLDSWQTSTSPIHHIFIQFFVPFGLHSLRFWYYISKSFVVQWLRLLAMDWLIVGSNHGLVIFFSFFFSKRNKKLNKNMMKEGSNSANCPAKANQL